MSRLVVVSNRLPGITRDGGVSEPEAPVGGLASSLLSAIRSRPGGFWFGWNGKVVRTAAAARTTSVGARDFDLAGTPLTLAEHRDHYLGFCNQTLWPLLHSFQERVRIRPGQETCYRQVQARFAASLLPLLHDDDLVWLHDFHLMPLGAELRRRGWRGRIGFFLHTPFPPHDLWRMLPGARGLLESLLAYDVVGFNVPGFLDNYVQCCQRELGARREGVTLSARGRLQRADIYPVGIDPEVFRDTGDEAPAGARAALGTGLTGRRLILGVDRLDYSKGIPRKILGVQSLLERHPGWLRRVVFQQIAAPSRTGVPDYMDQKRRIEALMGRVNGELGDDDWTPIRYLHRSYSRPLLARLYREADVGLVTPLRDGMSLVAKEFVAAQRPDSPGVLVLSQGAGAAEELGAAVIVNPFVPADMAAGIARALAMPLEERQERHASLLRRVVGGTAAHWARRFLGDLARYGTEATSRDAVAVGSLRASLFSTIAPLRSVH